MFSPRSGVTAAASVPEIRSLIITRYCHEGGPSPLHRVKLDPVDGRVVVNRPGVRGAPAQGLPVGLASSADIRGGDRRERVKFDRVDLDLPVADAVAPALPDLGPFP